MTEEDRVKQMLRLTAALRWTEDVEPDVPAGDERGGYVVDGWPNLVMATPKLAMPCYSTKLLALRKARYEFEKHVAATLLAIDDAILAEKGIV